MEHLAKIFKSRESIFYIIVSFCVFIYILFTLLNYDVNWMHPEVAKFQIPYIFENGRSFLFADFLRCFNCLRFDLNYRSRFLSYLSQIVNSKFRIWLFNFIPPHPSLSLTWIFTFILSPFFLFRLVDNLTSNRIASWISVLLYVASSGCLSLAIMLFHPAKPLSNFLAIFCLYLASRINLSIKSKGEFSQNDVRLYIALLFILFLAFFSDETAYFIFPCIPLFFPRIFKTKNNSGLIFLVYCLTFVGFLMFVTFVAPIIIRHLGFGNFDYWGYVIARITTDRSNLWKLSAFNNIFLSGHYLLSSHIVPFRRPDLNNFFKVDIYVYILFFLYCFYSFTCLSRAEKKMLKRMCAVLSLFILFNFFLIAKYSEVTTDCYYYGTLFSIFFVLPLSILLSVKYGFLKILNKIILVFLLVVFASNFYTINQRWNYGHTYFYKLFYPKETQQMLGNKVLTYPMVLRAWKSRNDKNVLSELKNQFPKRAYWLFVELDYLRKYKD